MKSRKILGLIALCTLSLSMLVGVSLISMAPSAEIVETEQSPSALTTTATTLWYQSSYETEGDIHFEEKSGVDVYQNISQLEMYTVNEVELRVFGYYDGKTYEEGESPLSFSVEDKDIVEILSVKGTDIRLKGLTVGKTSLTAITPAGKTAKIDISVFPAETGITTVDVHTDITTGIMGDHMSEPVFVDEEVSIKVGETLTLSLDSRYYGGNVEFSVENEAVAKIDSFVQFHQTAAPPSVTISGLSAGETIVKVSTKYAPVYTDTVKLTVIADKTTALTSVTQQTTSTTSLTTTAAPEKKVQTGDVNSDKSVDSKDATFILIEYAKALNDDKEIRAEELPAGDFNGDGYVDSRDATAILIAYAEYLVNL